MFTTTAVIQNNPSTHKPQGQDAVQKEAGSSHACRGRFQAFAKIAPHAVLV